MSVVLWETLISRRRSRRNPADAGLPKFVTIGARDQYFAAPLLHHSSRNAGGGGDVYTLSFIPTGQPVYPEDGP